MAGACPALSPDDPMVRGLLGVVDCNVRDLIHSGYSTLFQPGGVLTGVLTAILTLYVAFIGYRLMLGRGSLSVGEFALTAVKIGGVLALATQWDTYQAVVYNLLFQGPEQLATSMLTAVQPDGSSFHGDVFDGLQRAFDDLTRFSTGFAARTPVQTSPLVGGAGFAAFLLTSTGSILLLSSLGVLLASKIVLGLLLAVGPIFIALFLFDATRGLFVGWLRASLAFAFAPLTTTLLLGVALTMLEPVLAQIEDLQKQAIYTLGPVYSVMTLILVFAGVSAGALVASAMIAGGLRLHRRESLGAAPVASGASRSAEPVVMALPRAARVAAAAAALDRRDGRMIVSAGAGAGDTIGDRRSLVTQTVQRSDGRDPIATPPTRLGERRRTLRPQTPRPTARTAR